MRLIGLAACAALVAGLGSIAVGSVPPAAAAGHPVHSHAGHGSTGLVTAAVSLSVAPERPRADGRAALTFTLSDASGEPLKELAMSHERKLHAVIVSEDMAVFGHVHPEDFGEAAVGGQARVFFTFPHGGRYLVGVDFATEAGPQAAELIVDVEGPPSAGGAPEEPSEAKRSAQVRLAADDSYTDAIRLGELDGAPFSVALEAPQTIRAGEAVTFIYRFAEGGAPIDDLRPYLGAAMHVAAVKDDLTAFMHGHGEPAGAQMPGHGGHAASDDGAVGSGVAVTLTFPETGRYFLFGQAARGDRMLVTRMAVQVR